MEDKINRLYRRWISDPEDVQALIEFMFIAKNLNRELPDSREDIKSFCGNDESKIPYYIEALKELINSYPHGTIRLFGKDASVRVDINPAGKREFWLMNRLDRGWAENSKGPYKSLVEIRSIFNVKLDLFRKRCIF